MVEGRSERKRSDSRERSDHRPEVPKSRDLVKSLWDDVEKGKIQHEKITDKMKVKMITYKLDMLDLHDNIYQSSKIEDYEGQRKWEKELKSKEEEFKKELKEWGIEWPASTQNSEVSTSERLLKRLAQLREDCCPSSDRLLQQINSGEQLRDYSLGKLLGKGGFGKVFLGKDGSSGKEVAVKVLRPPKDGIEQGFCEEIESMACGWIKAEHVERFCKEIESMADLDHPNIVRLLDCGSQDKVPFLVMEYMPGGTLEGRKVSPSKAVEYMGEICHAVDYMHKKGLIHRDLKPTNLLLGENGEVKVTDFGLAAPIGTKEVVGNLKYMAPEQLKNQACSPQSDVYSLGLIFYELVTRKRLIDRMEENSLGKTWEKKNKRQVDNYQNWEKRKYLYLQEQTSKWVNSKKNLDIPREFRQVLVRALHKNPEKRYPSAMDFVNALEQACRTGGSKNRAAIYTTRMKAICRELLLCFPR